jgi:putative ABC transport system permease protein
MSFTVARQTREIGIRVALGADRRRIITGVFSRALIQIAIGVVAGTLIWAYAIVYELDGGDRVGLLVTTAAVLGLVGLLACGVPVRRALQIEPAVALKDTG